MMKHVFGNPNCAQRSFCSECVNAQVYLNLRLVLMSEGNFSDIAAQIISTISRGCGTLPWTLDWLQSPVTNYFFLQSCLKTHSNKTKQNDIMTIKAGIYGHDIILVLF